MQLFIMNSHEVFIHIHQGFFAGTGAIVRLPQCQWSKPDGYGKISQCITTTKHSKAKTVCIFLGIYCTVWCRSYTFNTCPNTCNSNPVAHPYTNMPLQLYLILMAIWRNRYAFQYFHVNLYHSPISQPHTMPDRYIYPVQNTEDFLEKKAIYIV